MNKKCNITRCPREAIVLGSCLHCWVTRQARLTNLIKYKWFNYHRLEFEARLKVRYTALLEGVNPPDKSIIYDVFLSIEPRPHHSPGRKFGGIKLIDKIINTLDKRALEKLNGTKHNSSSTKD